MGCSLRSHIVFISITLVVLLVNGHLYSCLSSLKGNVTLSLSINVMETHLLLQTFKNQKFLKYVFACLLLSDTQCIFICTLKAKIKANGTRMTIKCDVAKGSYLFAHMHENGVGETWLLRVIYA